LYEAKIGRAGRDSRVEKIKIAHSCRELLASTASSATTHGVNKIAVAIKEQLIGVVWHERVDAAVGYERLLGTNGTRYDGRADAVDAILYLTATVERRLYDARLAERMQTAYERFAIDHGIFAAHATLLLKHASR
jgi:hypothetical protein